MKKITKSSTTFKKMHRWPGLFIAFVLLYFAVSGIVMNHRDLFSCIDISRSVLPKNYRFQNWNNAAIKGNTTISPDSILVYGNIGIWLTDASFKTYISFNNGFIQGSDNRKIFDVHKDANGNLYAATLFGLYAYDKQAKKWCSLDIDTNEKRFVGIESIGDTIYAINRSFLFKGKSKGINTQFNRIELPTPNGYSKRVTLFSTIWQIHSGEILGFPGKLLVDLLGVVTILLSLTGIAYFFFPSILTRFKKNKIQVNRITTVGRWAINWHNKLGVWTFALLIVVYFSGMFLRPPLLIPIANTTLNPIKFTHLDQPNPWYDRLRDILYDANLNSLLLSTSSGMYTLQKGSFKPIPVKFQPPVSVMGINVLQKVDSSAFLAGSFSGLFLWHPNNPISVNYMTGEIDQGYTGGRPVGAYKISGMIKSPNQNLYVFDYDKGAIALSSSRNFPPMPINVINDSPMSLWNVCLEIHTGRFFQNLLSDFYILLVPIASLLSIMVVISGFFLWEKKYRKTLQQQF